LEGGTVSRIEAVSDIHCAHRPLPFSTLPLVDRCGDVLRYNRGRRRVIFTHVKTVRRYLLACLAVGALLIAGCGPQRGSTTAAPASCSHAFAAQFSFGDCFANRIPAQTLRDALFPVVDPRAVVHRLTGLRLNGIFVAYLGSDDLDRSHPKGPLIVVDFAFGTPPRPGQKSHAGHPTYVTVWEDANQWYLTDHHPSREPEHAPGWWLYRDHFSRYRMEFQVSTDGTEQQVVTVARTIIRGVHAQPVRPVPAPRLYVHAPAGSLRSGHPATFFVLNNGRASGQPAVDDLVLPGGWKPPKVQAAYSGQAGGGDNVPWLTRRSKTIWNLQFGDCDEIELIVIPVGSGIHRLRIRTYRVTIRPDGTIEPGSRSLVPHGGYDWEGQVQSV
jgi:hypothetical protein